MRFPDFTKPPEFLGIPEFVKKSPLYVGDIDLRSPDPTYLKDIKSKIEKSSVLVLLLEIWELWDIHGFILQQGGWDNVSFWSKASSILGPAIVGLFLLKRASEWRAIRNSIHRLSS